MYRWSRWFLTVALCLLAVWLPQPRANAAQPVYLFLQANGSEIQGESQQVTLGRAGAIECLSYEQSVLVPFERNGRSPPADVNMRRFGSPNASINRLLYSSKP